MRLEIKDLNKKGYLEDWDFKDYDDLEEYLKEHHEDIRDFSLSDCLDFLNLEVIEVYSDEELEEQARDSRDDMAFEIYRERKAGLWD